MPPPAVDAHEAQGADAGGRVRLAARDCADQGPWLRAAQAGHHQAAGQPLPVRPEYFERLHT